MRHRVDLLNNDSNGRVLVIEVTSENDRWAFVLNAIGSIGVRSGPDHHYVYVETNGNKELLHEDSRDDVLALYETIRTLRLDYY